MTRELEARLLASIPSVGHFQHLEQLGIKEETFVHYGPMYHYIAGVVREHNHLPRLIDLKAAFNLPEHVVRKTEEHKWLLDEFLRVTTVQRIQEIMDNSVDRFGDEPQELLPSLIKELTQLQLPDQRGISITDSSLSNRLSRYAELEATNHGMMIGIPTGIRYFDVEYRIGWMPGELIGIVGRMYIGKSWLLQYFGLLSWMFGKRVLFISPEMTEEESEARFDALLFGLHDIPVDVSDLYRGIKPSSAQEALAKKLENQANWITMSNDEGRAFRIGEIPRFIRQHSPNVVLIDGLLLVGPDGRGQAGWEQVKELSYGLKNIAAGNEVTIIVAHQANRGAQNTARPPGLHEIYMGDAFAQACDRVIVLSQPTTQRSVLRLTIQKFRKGKPLHKGTDFHFEPSLGKVKELDEHLGAIDDIGDNGDGLQEGKGDVGLLSIP